MPTVINVYDTVASIGVNDPEASLTIYEMFIGVGPTGPTGATGPAGASGVAGKLPNSYAELSSPEGVTSATLVDIPGMSTTITLEEAVEIAVLCSFELQTQDGSSASTIGIAVNINGTDYDSYSLYLSGSNDTGIGAITHRSAELAPGTYTVKMRFQRTSGVSTPGVNHMDMLVMGLQGAQGADGTDGTVTAVTDATSDMLFGETNVWTKKTLAEGKTILGITNAPNVATDATSDMMFGVANAWAKKTLAEGKSILGVPSAASIAEVTTGTDTSKFVTPDALMNGVVHPWGGTISNPQAVYAQRAQLFIAKTASAVTVTSIFADCNDPTPTAEIAWDLKFADDMHDGVFANATIVDVLDTTNGTFSATSGFDDATIPANKYVYLQFDSAPHADIVDILVDIGYTVD